MENYTVYIHIAPNLKCYIGITCQKLNRRWHGGSGYKDQPKFYNAIKKYGWDNFYHGVLLTNLSADMASHMEQYLIELFDTVNNGYNQTTGGITGCSRKVSDETKRKISESLTGRSLSSDCRQKVLEQLSINRLNRQRGVYCCETGETFKSIKEAAIKHNLDAGHISQCCQGKRKTVGKLHWKYWEVDNGEMGRIRTY